MNFRAKAPFPPHNKFKIKDFLIFQHFPQIQCRFGSAEQNLGKNVPTWTSYMCKVFRNLKKIKDYFFFYFFSLAPKRTNQREGFWILLITWEPIRATFISTNQRTSESTLDQSESASHDVTFKSSKGEW